MFWIGLFIGVALGVLAMCFMRMSSHDTDCKSCKAYYVGVIRDKDSQIHGLKSTKGALAKEIQHLSFMNSGYRAR
jgi:hypothetical protein